MLHHFLADTHPENIIEIQQLIVTSHQGQGNKFSDLAKGIMRMVFKYILINCFSRFVCVLDTGKKVEITFEAYHIFTIYN